MVRPNAIVDPDRLSEQLVAVRLPARGTGRAPRRVRPAGRDRRRLPVDRRRPDPHRPVGRRGRPPHDVRRQRSAIGRRPRRGGDLPRPRADAERGRARPARRALVATEPWGREQWERLAEGAHFEGMESWVPWLVDEPIADHRRAARHRQGRADRAAPHARPGHRAARRGGRPRQGAGVDVGARSGQGVPAPARRARTAARRSGRVLDDRLDARQPRHADRAGVGLGPDRRRRHRARRAG